MKGTITCYISDDADFSISVLYFEANWVALLSSGFGRTSFGLYDFGK